jgi:photosystem II stability/assembly factor-like uncharacterized protein
MKKVILYFFIIGGILNFTITDNLYSQWVTQHSGTTAALYDINFIDENTGFIVGESTILKTTNGGEVWINKSPAGINRTFRKIQMINSNIVYCVGMFNTILKSTNCGESWIILKLGTFGTGFSLFSLFFINENTGWIGGQADPPEFYRTTNGGLTFDSIYTPNLAQRVRGLYFKDTSNGVASGDGGLMRRTTDSGRTWLNVSIPIGTYLDDFSNVSFINNVTGYVMSRNTSRIFKTTNFGLIWDSLPVIATNIPYSYNAIQFKTELKGWAIGPSAAVTTNGGINWILDDNYGGLSIFFINEYTGWISATAGRIHKTTTGGLTAIGNNYETTMPDFASLTNYPNPFNIETRVTIKINKKNLYYLEVYNISGEKVETIFKNRYFNEGEYNISYKGDKLSSGIYFLRLHSNKEQNSLTKKIVLIK